MLHSMIDYSLLIKLRLVQQQGLWRLEDLISDASACNHKWGIATMKGFPFRVPSQYIYLPQLKVCLQL